MFHRILFLLSYFLIVFVGVRLVEYYLTTFAGTSCNSWLLQGIFSCQGNDAVVTEKDQEKSDDNKEQFVPRKTGEVMLEDDSDNNFTTFDDFVEKVEDTRASVWVVTVLSSNRRTPLLDVRVWNFLRKRLKLRGIRTASYDCSQDPLLCRRYSLAFSTVMLTVPKSSMTSRVDVHAYPYRRYLKYGRSKSNDVYEWIQEKLAQKVESINSYTELEIKSKQTQYDSSFPQPVLSLVFESTKEHPPLQLMTLSVKFSGRVNFYHLRSQTSSSNLGDNLFAVNKFEMYNYGHKKGESFTYSCIELFLRTVQPELNDVFLGSLLLINMACWLELFTCSGGPLKRLLCFIWLILITNTLGVCLWMTIIQVLHLPSAQPFLKVCLRQLQHVMFTDFAATIRQDLIQVSQHLYVLFTGFLCYGLFLGYLHYKLISDEERRRAFILNGVEGDIREFHESVRAFLMSFHPSSIRMYRFEEGIERILHRLSLPDLWLHPLHSTDYVSKLSCWSHCVLMHATATVMSESESEMSDGEPSCSHECHVEVPSYAIKRADCVICLRKYRCRDELMCLPCGHTFHKGCIHMWLCGDKARSQSCPVCRWPADTPKHTQLLDLTE